MEKRLRRTEAYLVEAHRLGHSASWAWNVSTGGVYWSDELFRIYGLDPGTARPACPEVLDYIHPDDRPRVQHVSETAVQEQQDYEVAYRVMRPDGTIRHVNNLAHPVFNEGGTLVEYVGTIIDATERKQAEEALQTLQNELTHVTRVTMIGELAASLAHEINQPLGAIVNNSNACLRLLDKHRSQKQLREAVADIVKDANRATIIIERIRALTRASAPEKTSLQLKQMISDVLTLAQRELRTRRITVRTAIAEDLPRISGDRVQLQQVLLNIVMNGSDAMKAMSEDRCILTITCSRYEMHGRPAVLLTVCDLGRGFKPEDAERLFKPFYTTKPKGLGMGLRISRSIVEAHGGRLWANPNEGGGATFFCAFPALN